MKGYAKCNACGKFDMCEVFYYNGEALTPDYMCNDCFTEFDKAMTDIGLQMEKYGTCKDISDMEDL